MEKVVDRDAEETVRIFRTALDNLYILLDRIRDACLSGKIDIENHIYSKSVWNTLGLFFLKNDLPRLAEKVYSNMLETIHKYDSKRGTDLFKGLANNNLAVAMYMQGKMQEAKMRFRTAKCEQKRAFGPEEAEKSMANKALKTLSKLQELEENR